MHGNLICLPVSTGWNTMCMCVSLWRSSRGAALMLGPLVWIYLLTAEKLKKTFSSLKKMCCYVTFYLQPSDVLVCSLLWDGERTRARGWPVRNNSCWLLFLNFPCLVEAFTAIPDCSLSRLLLKVDIMSFLVYWITAWGNNSDGIRCHDLSGGFT